MNSLSNLSNEEMEDQLHWSGCASERAAFKEVVETLREESGRLFARRKDDQADIVRGLAERFEKRVQELDEKLDGFIKRSQERAGRKRR